jgi:hypothetical protein
MLKIAILVTVSAAALVSCYLMFKGDKPVAVVQQNETVFETPVTGTQVIQGR